MQKFTTELKIILGAAIILVTSVVIGSFVQVRERKINDARTKDALNTLLHARAQADTVTWKKLEWDSIQIDSLKLWMRNFVWIAAMGGLYV